MLISKNNLEVRNKIVEFDKRIEDMHVEFYKYHVDQQQKMPDWEGFERELIAYSRKKIFDLELLKGLDRVLYKFQNRKKIWLTWVEESHHISKI